MPEPRHAKSPDSRAEPLLSMIATLAESAVSLLGMLVLALSLITTIYAGITGNVDPLGVLITTAILATAVALAARRYNRSGAQR